MKIPPSHPTLRPLTVASGLMPSLNIQLYGLLRSPKLLRASQTRSTLYEIMGVEQLHVSQAIAIERNKAKEVVLHCLRRWK